MKETFEFGGEIVWRPTKENVDQANLSRFMKLHGIDTFDQLMQRSTEDVSWFTDAILKFMDIQFYEPYTEVVDLSKGIAWPHWCVNAKMNIIPQNDFIAVHRCIQIGVVWQHRRHRPRDDGGQR